MSHHLNYRPPDDRLPTPPRIRVADGPPPAPAPAPMTTTPPTKTTPPNLRAAEPATFLIAAGIASRSTVAA